MCLFTVCNVKLYFEASVFSLPLIGNEEFVEHTSQSIAELIKT